MSPTISNLLVLSLAAFRITSANPLPGTTQQVPEVIPGDGLPSLESLGLTSAKLYAMGNPSAQTPKIPFHTLFQAGCGPSDAAYAPVNDIIACFHYLDALGTTACGVPANYGVIQMCRAGQGQILGQSVTGNAESSYCRDVASGILWVINSCTRPQQDCAGRQHRVSCKNIC